MCERCRQPCPVFKIGTKVKVLHRPHKAREANRQMGTVEKLQWDPSSDKNDWQDLYSYTYTVRLDDAKRIELRRKNLSAACTNCEGKGKKGLFGTKCKRCWGVGHASGKYAQVEFTQDYDAYLGGNEIVKVKKGTVGYIIDNDLTLPSKYLVLVRDMDEHVYYFDDIPFEKLKLKTSAQDVRSSPEFPDVRTDMLDRLATVQEVTQNPAERASSSNSKGGAQHTRRLMERLERSELA